MNKRNRYLAIAGMACTAAGLLTSVGGTWAMLQGRGWMTGAVGLACAVAMRICISLSLISPINGFQREHPPKEQVMGGE